LPTGLFARLFARSSRSREEIAGPIRGELLGAEHLDARARALAGTQRLTPSGAGSRRTLLLHRLDSTRRILEQSHDRLNSATGPRDVSPAGAWLLDNFHVIEEHIREVRASLPPDYYRELPELARGPLAGYPRVYELAITLISHTEGRIDLDNVTRFVAEFQRVAPLSLGELWAIPAMLRLGLIESVRRMALRAIDRLDARASAEAWAARFLAGQSSEQSTGAAIAAFSTDHPPLTPAFVSRLLQVLHTESGEVPGLAWLEQWLGLEGHSVDASTAEAIERLALTQQMMTNSITSLRAVGRLDWRTFVEGQSRMEAVLRTDPSGVYPRMTFATRDWYRHVIERMARQKRVAEDGVARTAIELAAVGDADSRQGHVGYYLVDEGLIALEAAVGYRPTLGERADRAVRAHPNVVYVGGLIIATVLGLAAILALGGSVGLPWSVLIVGLAFLPVADAAVAVVNQLITAVLPPRMLPKLDLHRTGVPPEFRTAVVIPTLFPDLDAVGEALETLEIRFLANREAHLHFAILSDFTDAPAETLPADDEIVRTAREGVRSLNARYAPDHGDAFSLFHRPRKWNERQGVWMGWERKRGKLAEFNRFVQARDAHAFSIIEGNVERLHQLRYVITLDADTVLPPDSAPDLVGAIAHPLNRAEYDPIRRRVVRGYGILQPRVGVSLPSASRSRFAAIFSGRPGVDPYTTAVSDVYQDLYGEGSYTGKGIYDLAVFERATHGRFPENRLLSHDLIEGNYTRTGLVTDVIIYDDYPASYATYTRRKHRWIRGDWQLLQWLTGTVPGPDGPEPNRLSVLSRWKILDNLRRSTVEIAHLALLVAGWTILPGSPLRWTLLSLGIIAIPWLGTLLLAAIRLPVRHSWRAYFGAIGLDAIRSAGQVGLGVVFLPHQAWISGDAIVRTLWRLLVSRRRLLEWQSASAVERAGKVAHATARGMQPAAVLSMGLAILVGGRWLESADPGLGWPLALAALPLLIAWGTAPTIATALDAPAIRPNRRLSPDSRHQLLRYALLHWRFFDRFVGTATNWLAPDNFQEEPEPVTALRTSPTNVGLQLLATVSAHDLGFLTPGHLVDRLERTFATLERLPRFRGHFYNWYDVVDLSVLEPAYVSTVDSGNLAGHLIAFRQACLTLPDEPRAPERRWRAVRVALEIAAGRLAPLLTRADPGSPTWQALNNTDSALDAAQRSLPGAGEAPDPDALVAELAMPLREAVTQIVLATLPAEEMESVREWIDWSLQSLDDAILASSPGTLRDQAESGSPVASDLVARLERLARQAADFALAMEFGFLLDPERKLLAIGYQMTSHSLDASSYDLLASEARLASFMAIAKNDIPVDHWFRLGRTLTYAAGAPAMVSWSGSMFEYLMPALVMESFPFTLLDQTQQGALRRQIAYGQARGVPWGISESAFNLRDAHGTYQYRAFGVPDLALKRGLGRDLVVAPYASALAALVDPERAVHNLASIERLEALGPYGFRDAIDYSRPDREEDGPVVVRNFMAHHLGMSLAAFTNVLRDRIWQRRFHTDPLVRSVELLLHERIPQRLTLQEPRVNGESPVRPEPLLDGPAVREIEATDTLEPQVALLGRPPLTLMISHCGGGYSRYHDLAIGRWRADGTTDDTGQFCYVRDVTRGRLWSASHQPVCAPADWYRATLAVDRVTFHRADGDIETRTEVAVVPDEAAEVRRVTLTNNGTTSREIELTSYNEVVLAPPDADRAHPAFGNLFVETEWHPWCTAITARRRPRSAADPDLWCVHLVDAGVERVGAVSFETDRARFLGRGRSVRDPLALEPDRVLSGTAGAVLDPIFALRTRVRLAPGQSASVAFTTLIATSRERAFELAGRYHDRHAAQRALDLARTSSQVELGELGLTPADATIFQQLAGHIFFGSEEARAPEAELRRARGSQPRLWAHGISGDGPIVLATISDGGGIPTLRQILAAHRFWRRRGMVVDLVILNAHPTTYQADLDAEIAGAVSMVDQTDVSDRPGGVFIRRRDLIGPADLLVLRAAARILIPCDGRPLSRIVEALETPRDPEAATGGLRARLRWAERSSHLRPSSAAPPARSRAASLDPPTRPPGEDPPGPPSNLELSNGLGGLTPEGNYQIRIKGDRLPPAPWSNVIANRSGGFLVTERGGGFTWAENSYFFRLTPWHNDPVGDMPTEIIYLRDNDTGELWCPTPAPVQSPGTCTVVHTPGRTTFHRDHGGIATRLRLGMVPDQAIKCAVLQVTNGTDAVRRLSLTAYAEWTLGTSREQTQQHVVTTFEPAAGAIFAHNTFDPQYAGWAAFHALSEPLSGHTGNRREFIGRNGTLVAPAALTNASGSPPPLSGVTGACIDPCSALQCQLELAPGQSREVVILLGAMPDLAAARQAVADWCHPLRAAAALTDGTDEWDARLARISVRTPEPLFDTMMNRWLLYQTLSCRMWARSALYQSSGAFGFRDQLQDAMALVYAEPGLARAHLLRAAARQFLAGDVQHWWHPETGRGVRTRFSDDLVWLPYVVDHYVRITGDRTILDEWVPFLRMRELRADEQELYDLPEVTTEHATVHEHCLRALRRASTAGSHGLPLIGGGDWNDGMNRVGIGGRGESVWLAWFLIATLRAYALQAEARGERGVAAECRAQADRYATAVEAHGWDGAWYRRAYYDDGTPLGSAESDECRIDAIAQSWSVISGAGDPARQAQAMAALEKHLVRPEARLIQLLDPPFDQTPQDPGYIKGYLPGVRENGAQYTHAALWVVLAKAMQGDGDRAFALYQMLNPLTHGRTPDEVQTYQVEPYVVAADVYTATGHLGRGGWTWYTGSASWMYRIGLENILGFTRRGAELCFEPAVPESWPEFSMEYRYGTATYDITVHEPARVRRESAVVTLDGQRLGGSTIPLRDDRRRHTVVVTAGGGSGGMSSPEVVPTNHRSQGSAAG